MDPELRAIFQRAKVLALFLLSFLIDAGFVVIWLYGRKAIEKAVEGAHLDAFGDWTVEAVEFCLSASALLVLVVYIYRDLARAIKRIWNMNE